MGDDFKKEFGAEIKRARKHGHLKQEDLGKRIGVAKSAISKYESGESDIAASKVNEIAKACDYTFQIPVRETDMFKKELRTIAKQVSFEGSGEDEKFVEWYINGHKRSGVPESVVDVVSKTAALADIYDEKGSSLPKECITFVMQEMIAQEREKRLMNRLRAYVERIARLEKKQ